MTESEIRPPRAAHRDRPAVSAAAVRDRLGPRLPPIAIVLGSGMSGIRFERPHAVAYSDLAGWPRAGVAGHAGELVLGSVGGVSVLGLRGRAHMYEGHPAADVVIPIRVLGELGVRAVILTNAAGSLDSLLRPGRLMLIADHINRMARSPLAGAVVGAESRWPDLLGCYDPGLRAIVRAAAREERIALREGVYAGVLGPSYETPAEVRMLRRLGATAVGMSTVPEAIAARALGMRVVGISCITNLASGVAGGPLVHTEVVQVGAALTPILTRLLCRALPRILKALPVA